MYDKIASWGAVCCCIAKVVETDLIRNFEILKPYVVGHLTDDPASMVEHRVFCIMCGFYGLSTCTVAGSMCCELARVCVGTCQVCMYSASARQPSCIWR